MPPIQRTRPNPIGAAEELHQFYKVAGLVADDFDRPDGKVKPFSNPGTDEKYRQLGFSAADLSFRLTIGDVSIYAVEPPFKGVALIFESITPRSMCQYEVSLPERCSVDQIAGLIYVNVLQSFRGSAEKYKAHFQKLGLPLFQ